MKIAGKVCFFSPFNPMISECSVQGKCFFDIAILRRALKETQYVTSFLMYCIAWWDPTPFLHHQNQPVQPVTFYFLLLFLLYFACVGGTAERNSGSEKWRREGLKRPSGESWKKRLQKPLLETINTQTHTHTQARTHKYIWAARYGFDGGITLRCLIHECFPPFWSQTWKQEFCPEKKQNGWTHQYSDNARLPVRRAGERACAYAMGSGAPTRTFAFCNGLRAVYLHLFRLLCEGFAIAMLFLRSSSRRKHNKSLFPRVDFLLSASRAERSWATTRENRGVGSSLCELT